MSMHRLVPLNISICHFSLLFAVSIFIISQDSMLVTFLSKKPETSHMILIVYFSSGFLVIPIPYGWRCLVSSRGHCDLMAIHWLIVYRLKLFGMHQAIWRIKALIWEVFRIRVGLNTCYFFKKKVEKTSWYGLIFNSARRVRLSTSSPTAYSTTWLVCLPTSSLTNT